MIFSGAFVQAWATTTSTIAIGGTDYTLFTGFTATDGSTGVGVFTYDKAVDGDMSSSWHDQSSGIYVEFNTDEPIIPKGYIFNTYNADNFKPTGWELKAKANDSDNWTELSSYSNQSLASGQEFQYVCNNDGNTKYKYFRFEASNNGNNIWLTEIRLYGFENLTYTHLTVRAATCTETGIKQDCYLRSDGKYFTDETGATELAESAVIDPKIAHTGVHYEADENHIEYWQCSVCNKYFSDSGCTNEISENQTLVLKYLDSNGTLTTLTENATAVTSSLNTWSNGWYVVYENIEISDRITVSGTVNLILCNGATLTASKGITVGSGATFNVYAQTTDEATMGALVASTEAQSNNAAIGGMNNVQFGSIVINGGKITATTNNNCGAAIGGGYGSNSGSITINGGIVSATAGNYSSSAGIGGGNNGHVASVTLNGGIITATGDAQYGGAGIGTGSYASSGTMTITIGNGVKKIVAVKGSGSECIGKQPNANTTVNVIFKNGETAVEGDAKNAVFYDSGEGSQRQIRTKALNHTVTIADDIKASVTPDTEYALAGETVTLTLGTAVDASTLKVNNGTVSLTNTGDGKCTFTMPDGNVTVTATVAETYSVNLPSNMEIVSATNAADANGKYISGTVITFKPSFPYTASNVSDGTNTLTATDGVYSVTVGTADITITATVQRSSTIDLSGVSENFTAENGDVLTGTTDKTVVIAEGASITLSGATINGGIVCNSNGNITIILVGTNSVTGEYGKAGIQIGGSGTTLTIKGDGSLAATGGYDAAGIGLNRAFNVTSDVIGGNILIEGGTITATGGGGGAGIGAGVTKDTNNSSSRKAIVGNITIKGGTVKATGGTNADGIGAGQNDYNATIEIGTVTVYDGINLVDASSIKDFDSVVYMHGEDNVTSSKTDYFTIGEDGDRRVITQKDDTDYTITIADNIEHGTITGAATAKYMEKITITATPAFGYRFKRLIVKDSQNNDVSSTGNSFFMPKGNVTVSAEFGLGSHGTTEFTWMYSTGAGTENEVRETIYDGMTTVNIQQIGQPYSIRKYDENTYSKFLLDNSTYEASIPYAGGTGAFYETGNPTSFSLPDNGETGYYDITMTEANGGKWSVSILKTAPQMDEVPNQVYTGSAITPEPLVIAGSLSLTKGTDYEYSYTDNTDVGTNAKVTVTFKGNYESLGSVEKMFTIILAVFVSGSIEHGNVIADKSGAVEGETVTLTITPVEGYNIGTVSYNDTEITSNDGIYSFTMPAVSVTISVTFTPIEYTITYDLDDGTVATANPTKYTIETETFTLNNPTKTGYTFTGWTGTDLTEATITVTIEKGSTGSREYTANWKKKSGSTQEDDPTKPTFRAHALKLDGEIAAIFYMNLPVLDGVNYADSYMDFTLSEDQGHLDEPRAYYADTVTTSRNNITYYGFKCPVASSQMADTITATLHYGNNLTVSQDYSVVQYLDEVLEGNYTGTDKDLMLAIQDYGHYAQLMLSEANDWEIGTDHATIEAKNPDIASDVETVKGLTSSDAFQKTNNSTGIRDIGFALLLETVTSINVYFDIAEGYEINELKVMVDGTEKSAIPLHGGTQYMIQIPNIPAQDLNKAHTITGNESGEFSVSNLSALSYVNKVLNSTEDIGGVDIATMKNAVTAFYKYHKATLDYMAQ